MKLLFAFAFTLGLVIPIKADAGTAYVLYFVQYSPFPKTVAAGPFDRFNECMAVKGQQSKSKCAAICAAVEPAVTASHAP